MIPRFSRSSFSVPTMVLRESISRGSSTTNAQIGCDARVDYSLPACYASSCTLTNPGGGGKMSRIFLSFSGKIVVSCLLFMSLLLAWKLPAPRAGAGGIGEGTPACPAEFACYGLCADGILPPAIVGNADSFVSGPSMTTARASFATSPLQFNGEVPLSIGGNSNCNGALNTFRFGLVAGGLDAQGNATSTAELFGPLIAIPNPSEPNQQPTQLYDLGFAATGNMTTARVMHQATLFASSFVAGTDGISMTASVLITGGSLDLTRSARHTSTLASAEIYTFSAGWPISMTNPAPSGQFAATTGAMNQARALHQATLLATGKVLITGGVNQRRKVLASAEIFDPTTGTFTLTKQSMKHPRYGHSATLLPDGTVLIVGGEANAAGYPNLTAQSVRTAEIYNPATDTFQEARPMDFARAGHTASIVACPASVKSCSKQGNIEQGNAVLIAGGITPAGVTASAEVYVPTGELAGSFTRVKNMTTRRFLHSAAPIAEGTSANMSAGTGEVLIAGGSQTANLHTILDTAERFDPTTGTFKATSDTMITARRDFSAGTPTPPIVLYDLVVLSGGADSTGKSLSSTEYYLPELFTPAQ